MTLTEQQKADYIADRGAHCPYCGSDNFDLTEFVGTKDIAEHRDLVGCRTCHHSWFDIFKLVDVEENEDDTALGIRGEEIGG